MFPFTLPQLAIAFPDIDPVIVQLGPVAIRWYSMAYIVGIVLGWLYAKRLAGNARLWGGRPSAISAVDLDDFLVWATIGIVLGGRLGFVLFYDLPLYLQNPAEILAIWRGGMSFHGGLIGTTVAMAVFAWRRGIPVWPLIDIVAAVAPIGLFFGRIANFINSELWGRPTDVPWAVVFPNGGDIPRHPSQLYEAALEGVVLFLVLRLCTHRLLKLRRPRFVTGVFIAGYGLARTFVEFFRQPDPQLGYLFGGWLTMGMTLSIPMIVLGVVLAATAGKIREESLTEAE
ncbi:prolipoprotein diacylglyceryl transferase [Oricola cellulosilytica]|uniref:Phosphatidylglycerol--prolipoprotein diacylglyceryl transferase n=1 Tax=Oricola cellulosilytica TaxID=1429082 RepID=A0A4R0PDE4_9HYPH|nr:prolipoprotein diacylglyceryl transferase [Oricola cellulosilytica]TCD15326.1 prolipoprotein diacylglyceryl transferase [Oricola cellulosilytica]